MGTMRIHRLKNISASRVTLVLGASLGALYLAVMSLPSFDGQHDQHISEAMEAENLEQDSGINQDATTELVELNTDKLGLSEDSSLYPIPPLKSIADQRRKSRGELGRREVSLQPPRLDGTVGVSSPRLVGAPLKQRMSSAPTALNNWVWAETPRFIPSISLKSENGDPLSLSDYGGKPVLINFWATWCGPCRIEMPALDKLQVELGVDNFVVLPINIERNANVRAREFYDEIQLLELPLVFSGGSLVMGSLSVRGLPTTILVDAKGFEVARLTGPAEWDDPEAIEFLRKSFE